MSVRENIWSFVESKVTASLTSAGTVASGISSAMAWIPEALGYTATTIGIILSSVMIYNQWHNGKAERKKTHLETEVLKAKLAEIEKALRPGGDKTI